MQRDTKESKARRKKYGYICTYHAEQSTGGKSVNCFIWNSN